MAFESHFWTMMAVFITGTTQSGGVGVTSEQEIFQILANRCESIEGAESNRYAKISTYSPAETSTKAFPGTKSDFFLSNNLHH